MGYVESLEPEYEPDPRSVQYAYPDGWPAPTGYYPNDRGHLQTPVPGQNYDTDQDAYATHATVIQGDLSWTETIDQHPYVRINATWTPAPNFERPDGHHDPLTDGPPPGTIDNMHMYYTRQQGTSQTHLLDVPGHRFPTSGSQDGAAWTTIQDLQQTMRPYDASLTTPISVDPSIPREMPDTEREIAPSPEHGWTSQPLEISTQEILKKTKALTQQQPGKQEFLANSTYAGQSYGTQSAHVGSVNAVVPSRRPRG